MFVWVKSVLRKPNVAMIPLNSPGGDKLLISHKCCWKRILTHEADTVVVISPSLPANLSISKVQLCFNFCLEVHYLTRHSLTFLDDLMG